MTETAKREKPRRPEVGKLTILLLHEKDPDANGSWTFRPVLPNEGTCDMRIVAKDVETAKGLLESWLANELAEDVREDPE